MSDFKFNCPHCDQSLEAPEEVLGQSIECPACNGSIQLPATQQQPSPPPAPPNPVNETEVLREQGEKTSKVKHGVLISAMVCFVIGIILMFVSLWWIMIYAPLFLAAFILSIIVMSQKRMAAGLVMLLLTIIIPPVLFLGLGMVRGRDVMEGVSTAFLDASSEMADLLIPDHPLAGRHSGKEWKGRFVYHSSFRSDEEHYGFEIYETERPDRSVPIRAGDSQESQRRLIGKIPRNPGQYPLSGMFNVTFFEPPGSNKTAGHGMMKVNREGNTYKVGLIADFDEDNDVRGFFSFIPPAEDE